MTHHGHHPHHTPQAAERRLLVEICLLAILLAAYGSFFALPAPAQTQPQLSADGILFPLQDPPGQVRNASVAPIGNPGLRSQYYWVVTNGLFGQGPLAGPFVLSRAGDTFGASYALASGTYTSGITATGTVGQTCSLTAFNNGSSARATVALTGLNTIAGGASLLFADLGTGATAVPTSATAGNGSATCSGTATIATVLGSNYSAGAQLQWSAVAGATSYDCLRTATAVPPSGTGNYAVATGLTSPGCTDLSESLSSYTVNPSDPAEVAKRMQNRATGVDTSCVAIDGVCIATGSGAAFYQTDQQAGAAKPQELVNNFLSGFTLTDDPGNQSTDIKLTAFGNTCPEGEVQNGFNSDGSISCVAGGGGGSNVYAPQKVELSSPVTLDTTQTIILTESVTFPSTAGVYRADVRYGVWLNSDGSRFCAIEAVDTTNGIAFAMGGAGTQGTSVYYSPTASEISTATYAAGSTATFTLQSVCNATGISAVPSNLASSVLPPEPSYLSVTPIGPPTGAGGGAPSEPEYSVQTNYPDGSFGNGLGDFLDYAPILGPLTFTGDGIDAETTDDGTSTVPEFYFAVDEMGTSSGPCPACFLVYAGDTIQSGGNIGLSAYGATGGVVAIMGASPAQGPLFTGPYGNPGSVLIEGSSDVTGSLTTGTVTINGQPYDDLAGALADVGNVAVNACGTSEDGVPAGGESCNVTLTANGLQQSYGYGGNVNLDAFGPTLAADSPGASSGNVNLSAYSAGVASENGSINLITFNSGRGPFDDTENDIWLFALNHIYLQSADLVTGTAPICPNGPDGALVNDGSCAGGGGGIGGTIAANQLVGGTGADTVGPITNGTGTWQWGQDESIDLDCYDDPSCLIEVTNGGGGLLYLTPGEVSVNGPTGAANDPGLSVNLVYDDEAGSVISYPSTDATTALHGGDVSGDSLYGTQSLVSMSGTGGAAAAVIGESVYVEDDGAGATMGTLEAGQFFVDGPGADATNAYGIEIDFDLSGTAGGVNAALYVPDPTANGDSAAVAAELDGPVYITEASLPAVAMVAEGSLALGTAAVSSYACNTVTQAAVGVDYATDFLDSASLGSFSSIAGYGPNVSGSLDVNVYIDPGGGQVDADVCNRTPAPLTPDAANISYAVLRAAQ